MTKSRNGRHKVDTPAGRGGTPPRGSASTWRLKIAALHEAPDAGTALARDEALASFLRDTAMDLSSTSGVTERAVRIPAGAATLDADLTLPASASGVVLFAHGSGSSRFSPRNRHVAQVLNDGGLATVLADLLTPAEETVDERTRHLRFDIEMLADRLIAVTDWLGTQAETASLPIGHFGASTGAGAALMAAASRPDTIHAVVSRGGRPDLAGDALTQVRAPTLLIVGGNDEPVIGMNQRAFTLLKGEKQLVIVPGATHLFEEPGTLHEVARLARDWFARHLSGL